MKIQFFCLFFLFFNTFNIMVYGQNDNCTIDVYHIKNESELDQFLIDYGDCDTIQGALYLSGNIDYTKLDFIKSISGIRLTSFETNYPVFDSLQELGGLSIYESLIDTIMGFNQIKNCNLSMHNNYILTHLDGFNNLEYIPWFRLYYQESDLSFSGFESLKYIGRLDMDADPLHQFYGGVIDFTNFDQIEEIEFLDLWFFSYPEMIRFFPNVRRIEEVSYRDMNLYGDITMFDNVDSIGKLKVSSFYNLGYEEFIPGQGYKDLDFLSDVTFYEGKSEVPNGSYRFLIGGNPELSRCHVPSICNYLDNGGTDIRFYSNAVGCNSIEEVRAGCALVKACTLDEEGSSEVVLTTQAEVDTFITRYQACPFLYGDIHIIGDLDLEGFNNFKSLRRLTIEGMEEDVLVGFDSLQTCEELTLIDNPGLEQIDAFRQLISIDSNLVIKGNEKLTHLDNFDSLAIVGGLIIEDYTPETITGFPLLEEIEREFRLVNCDNLVKFSRPRILQYISGSVVIDDNEHLENIIGLDVYRTDLTELSITNNPNLSICHIDPVCEVLIEADHNVLIQISNNMEGCDTEEEVVSLCMTPTSDYTMSPMKVFPNPATKSLYVEGEKSNLTYEIYDMLGKQLISKPLDGWSIDIHELQLGMYVLRLIDNEGIVFTHRFMKG